MMKKLLALLLILAAFPALAVDRITLSISITNNPIDGNTLAVNSGTRTWKTNVTTAGTQILIGSSIPDTTTNLFRHALAYPFSGPVSVIWVSTNQIKLVGEAGNAVSYSASGTWASFTTSTQAVTTLTTIRVPLSGETASVQTNNATQLVAGINSYSQTPLSDTATATANLVNLAQTQTITGAKTFTNAAQVWSGGYATNAQIDAAKLKYITNNSPLKFYTSGGARQYGIAPDANGIPSLYYIFSTDDLSTPGNYSPSPANLLNVNSANFIYGQLQAANNWTLSNNFALASGTFTNAANWNPTVNGTATFQSDARFTRYDLTTLASGNNAAIPIGSTNIYVRIPSGPTAAFTINGIASGANGRFLILENATGYAMTVANQSGTDPTAANRIATYSGTDISTVGNCVAMFVYDSSASRWKLVSLAGSGTGNISGTLTPGMIPYAASSSTLADSLALQRVDSISVGIGSSTNIITISGKNLVYTNSADQNAFIVKNTSGQVNLTAPGAGSIASVSTTSGTIGFSNSTGSFLLAGQELQGSGVTKLGGNSSTGAFLDENLVGSSYIWGSGIGTANYERLATKHNGSAGIVVDSQNGGTGIARQYKIARSGSDCFMTAVTPKALVQSTSAAVANVTVASGKIVGGIIHYTIHCNNGTDFQSRSGAANFNAVNKGGTVTASITPLTEDVAVSAGTLTVTWTAVANGNSVDLKANATSSLTPTVLECYWDMSLRGSGTATVTPQ